VIERLGDFGNAAAIHGTAPTETAASLSDSHHTPETPETEQKGERGAARAQEPAFADERRQDAEASQHRASEAQDGRSERPATGMGSPERRGTAG
jgi:hypothetical protein